MNYEECQSDISVNTNRRVFNGGVFDADKNLIKIQKIENNNITNNIKLDIADLEKKLANGLQETTEPLSFRQNIEVINNCSIDLEKLNMQNEFEMEENIFNNLKEKLYENDTQYVNRNEGYKFRSINTNTINCTISSIDKGIAILVTQDDTIFTLPAFFLPKNSIPGNSYQICIDETVKMQSKVTNINNIQKRIKMKKNKKSFLN
jgi:hypothetical protein